MPHTALIPPPTPASSRAQDAPPAAIGPKAAIGAARLSSTGKGQECQDTYISSTSPSGTKTLVGVFDGHGNMGGEVSHIVRDCLSRSLFKHKALHSDPRAALEQAYRETQKELHRKHGNVAVQSGTTAVTAYQYRDRLFVANVGDSRAVLGRVGRGCLNAVDLSRDHKPSRTDERKRIAQAGGRVEQGIFAVQAANGSVRLFRGGNERVIASDGSGGLAISRSLGDFVFHPYISGQPEITERKLDPKDKLLILASDGVWDQITSEEAVKIASRHDDPNEAAREIVSVARKRWAEKTHGTWSDDITAIVVQLESPSASGEGGAAVAAAGRASSRPTTPSAPPPGTPLLSHREHRRERPLSAARERPRSAGAASVALAAIERPTSQPSARVERAMTPRPRGDRKESRHARAEGNLEEHAARPPSARRRPATVDGGRSTSERRRDDRDVRESSRRRAEGAATGGKGHERHLDAWDARPHRERKHLQPMSDVASDVIPGQAGLLASLRNAAKQPLSAEHSSSFKSRRQGDQKQRGFSRNYDGSVWSPVKYGKTPAFY
eukprot:TRINITY_DN57197_c0_g1_i1.p1 TRINITY_DN57197_c0_g1~~TRINITY_DN57197_c0_g1_i1.p1  ORF type:complete len:553 (-),score=62.93 TRINITY_DN57197_c0_g1_i1:278-1936(-)